MARPRKVDDQLKRDMKGKELALLLRKAHLPKNYPKLNYKEQREARLEVLGSWYDPKRPNVLVTDLNRMLAAFFLWVEFYIKPAECNQGVYYFRDPDFKYDMVRTVFGPPIDPDKPSKTIVQATRRTGKTQTLIIEALPFIAINRPFSTCLLSEYNAKRTGEEMRKIQTQIEQNERIEEDFGGPGKLYPRSKSADSWSQSHLTFLRFPGCAILGHSIGSAQRGRGPIFGVIDDPETEDTSYNRDWRRNFMDKLFNVYVRMFTWGGCLLWIGTPIHASSCLTLAMEGIRDSDSDELRTEKENRWYDWKKVSYPVITQKPNGEWVSHQPDRISVKAFLRDLEADPISAMAEVLCRPTTPGARAFRFDPIQHGYARFMRNGQEWFLDLRTGEEKLWSRFIDELRVFGALDMSDGESEDSDPGAIVFLGVDPNGVTFVLDVFVGKVPLPVQMDLLLILGDLWKAELVAGEKVSMQVAINRMIRERVESDRFKGKVVPGFTEVQNAKKDKVRRVLAMMGLFGHHRIRFPHFEPVGSDDGVVVQPLDHERRACFAELIAQIQEYTNEGIRGPDDAIDCLEMATRISQGARGEIVVDEEGSKTDAILEKWASIGLELPPSQVPMHTWSDQMWNRVDQDLEPVGGLELYVPYT